MAVKMGGWVCKISNFQDIWQFLGSACMTFARASAPWKIFCFLLKFLLKKCYKCRVGSKKSESRGVGWLIEPRSLLGGACTSPHMHMADPTPAACAHTARGKRTR